MVAILTSSYITVFKKQRLLDQTKIDYWYTNRSIFKTQLRKFQKIAI